MKQLFKITKATDIEGRGSYTPLYYIGLEDEHLNTKIYPNGFVGYYLSDKGQELFKEFTGQQWDGRYDLEKAFDEINVLESRIQRMKSIMDEKSTLVKY